MKNLKKFKILFLAAFAFAYTTTSSAQDGKTTSDYNRGFKLGFGLNAGIPTDKDYSWALGGDARLQYDLSKRTSLTLTTGFTNLFVGNGPDLGFIPAKAGVKVFVWDDQFYILGEAGAAFGVTNGNNDTSFLWAPGIGYANKHFDLSVRYEDYNKFHTNQVALRLAYGFKL